MVMRYDKKKLSPAQKFVLLCLSDYMLVNGENAHPAQETLAAEMGVSRTTVDKAIKIALNEGILRKKRRSKPRNYPGKAKWSWAYEAVLPGDDALRSGAAGSV